MLYFFILPEEDKQPDGKEMWRNCLTKSLKEILGTIHDYIIIHIVSPV